METILKNSFCEMEQDEVLGVTGGSVDWLGVADTVGTFFVNRFIWTTAKISFSNGAGDSRRFNQEPWVL